LLESLSDSLVSDTLPFSSTDTVEDIAGECV